MRYAIAAAALALLTVPASATPIINGKYILTGRLFCQPTLAVKYVETKKIGKITLGRNTTQIELMLIDFDSKEGSANYGATYETGDTMLIQNKGVVHGLFGMPIVESKATGNLFYTLTDTTLSFGFVTYNALFGEVDNKNRAHYFAIQRTYTAEPGVQCAEQAEAHRQ